jgi:hypothetical protein
MKLNLYIHSLFFIVALSFFAKTGMHATNYTSVATGPWTTPATWGVATFPVAGDNVTITAGKTVTLTAPAACANITLTLLGKLATGVNTLTLTGNFTNGVAGGLSGVGGTILMTGSTPQTIGGTVTIAFSKLTINSTNTVTQTIANSVASAFLLSGGIFNDGGFALTGAATTTQTNGEAQYTLIGNVPALTGVYALTGGQTTFKGGAGNQVIKTVVYFNVNIDGGAGTKTLAGATTINGNLTIVTSTLVSGNFAHILKGNWSNAGGFTAGTGTITLSGAVPQTIGGVSVTSFNKLTITSTTTVTLLSNQMVNTTLSVTLGTFSTGVFTLTGTGTISQTGGILQIGTPNVLVPQLSGAFTWTAGTLSFNAAGNQTIKAGTYLNVVIDGGSGIKSLNGATVLTGDLTINTSTLDVVTGSNFALTVKGNWTNNALFLAQNGLVTCNNAAIKNMGGTAVTSFYQLTITSTSTLTMTNNEIVNNLFKVTAGTFTTGVFTLTGTGAITQTGGILQIATPAVTVPQLSGAFIWTAGTLTFDAAGNQTIKPSTYFNVIIDGGSGTKSLSGTTIVNGSLTINTSTLDVVSGSNYALTVKGSPWTNNATFLPQKGTVSFLGTVAQVLTGTSATSFYTLTVAPTAGTGLTVSKTITIANLLSLNATHAFTLTTGGNITLLSVPGQSAYVGTIIVPASLTITGNITMQRYIPSYSTGWSLMGSPGITGQTFAQWNTGFDITCATCPNGSTASGQTFTSIDKYSELAGGTFGAAGRYTGIANITDAMTNGVGFWVYRGNSSPNTTSPAITLTIAGPVQKGNTTLNLTHTAVGGGPTDYGWNLIANPYPAPVSWTTLKTANPSALIGSTIYVYSPNLNGGQGAYAQYINGGLSSPTVAAGGIDANIPMGQAFYVQVSGAIALNFTEAAKTTSQNNLLTPVYNYLQTVFRLVLDGPGGFHDETVFHFNTNATKGFDPDYDALKLNTFSTTAPDLSSLSQGVNYSINGLPDLTEDASIPVMAIARTTGTYTISPVDIGNLPAGSVAILHDNYTGTDKDLSQGGYTCILSDTTTTARFILNILAPVTGINKYSAADNSVRIGQDMNGVFLKFSNDSPTHSIVSVYDILGQKLTGDRSLTTTDEVIYLDLNNAHNQMILVAVQTDKKLTVSRLFNK